MKKIIFLFTLLIFSQAIGFDTPTPQKFRKNGDADSLKYQKGTVDLDMKLINGTWVYYGRATGNVFNVKDFGAIGDSLTDETVIFQTVLDTIKALGGGTMYIPEGVYRTTYTMMYASNTTISGSGMGSTKIYYDAQYNVQSAQPDGCAFLSESFDTLLTTTDVLIENFEIATSDSIGNGIGIIDAERVHVRNIKSNFVYYHMVDLAGDYITIENCYATGFVNAPIQIDNHTNAFAMGREFPDHHLEGSPIRGTADSLGTNKTSSNIMVTNNMFDSCAIGVQFHRIGARNVQAVNNTFNNCRIGIKGDNADFLFGWRNVVIDGNTFWTPNDTVTTHILMFNSFGSITRRMYTNTVISNNTFTGGEAAISVSHQANIVISGNAIDSTFGFTGNGGTSKTRGIAIHKSTGMITGNTLRKIGYTRDTLLWTTSTNFGGDDTALAIQVVRCSSLVLSNNFFENIYGIGVYALDNVINSRITNNYIKNSGIGVLLASNSDSTIIMNNTFTAGVFSAYGIKDTTTAGSASFTVIGNYYYGTFGTIEDQFNGQEFRLGSNSMTDVGHIDFSYLDGGAVHKEGRLSYDSASHSHIVHNEIPEVSGNLMRENWTRVHNVSGVTINDGDAVYFSGGTGELPEISLAQANDTSTANVEGLATHTILTDSIGYITFSGEVNGINVNVTNFTAGDKVFLSEDTAGSWVTIQPEICIPIGSVERAHAVNGTILVSLNHALIDTATVYGLASFVGTRIDISADIVRTEIRDTVLVVDIPSTNVTMDVIGTPTFTTVQDIQDVFHSTGYVSGGAFTDTTDGVGGDSLYVAGGQGLIRALDNDTTTLSFFDWGDTTFFIETDSTRFIGVDYNSGSPRLYMTASQDDFNYQTNFDIGLVVNELDILHEKFSPHFVGDHANNMIRRIADAEGIKRNNRIGGLIIGVTGTRNITVSSGELLDKLNRFPITAINTFTTDNFDRYYRDGSGGFTKQTAQTQFNNTQYDDNSGTLVTLGNNRFVNEWFWLELDNEIVSMYGIDQYTSSAVAELEQIPSDIPSRLEHHGILIGRVIVQEGIDAPVDTQSFFDKVFTPSQATAHDNLAGTDASVQHGNYLLLAGGTVDSVKTDTLIVDDKADLSTATTTLGTTSGAINAGGATSLEIPNGVNPTTDAEGEHAWDTDDNAEEFFDGTRSVLIPTRMTKEATISFPDGFTDTIPIWELDSSQIQNGVVIENLSLLTSVDGAYTLQFFSFTSADPPVLHDEIDTLITGAADQFVSSSTFENVDAQTLDVGQRLYILMPATDVDWIKIKIQYYIKDNN